MTEMVLRLLPRVDSQSVTTRWVTLLLLIGYALALVIGTHWPGDDLPWEVKIHDKILHAASYFGLAVLFYWASIANGWLEHSVRSLILVAVAVSVFGAVDELTQYFSPGRQPELLDWLADSVGGVLGACAFHIVYRLQAAQKFGVGGR